MNMIIVENEFRMLILYNTKLINNLELKKLLD